MYIVVVTKKTVTTKRLIAVFENLPQKSEKPSLVAFFVTTTEKNVL